MFGFPGRLVGSSLKVQDEYLRAETVAKGITELDDLRPVAEVFYLWQGDITTLRCETSVKKVVFNVFKDLDKEIYRKLL